MLKGFLNIALPQLMVCHDHALKKGVEIYTDQTFIRNQSSHDRFIEKYGWDWGYRNKMLRQQFENKLSGSWSYVVSFVKLSNEVLFIIFLTASCTTVLVTLFIISSLVLFSLFSLFSLFPYFH